MEVISSIRKWKLFQVSENGSYFKHKEMTPMFVILLPLFVGRIVGEPSSRSMILSVATDKSFTPSNLSTLLSQSLALTSLKCAQLCFVSSDCQVATYNTSGSSCSIYNVNVSAGSILSILSFTTYVVISVFPSYIPGKRRCIF
jgi:hypothetical protein